MKNYTYHFEIKDLLTQFAAAFDDIVIKRFNKNREPEEAIEVRYVLAPKQRVMYDIVNKAQNLTLPVIAINVNSITRDTTRVFHKLDKIYNFKSETSSTGIKMPVPINISVSVSILARYMQDMDQILSNFIPYTNPYVIISWKEPTSINGEIIEIRSEVLWDGSISLKPPTDMAYSEKFRITADTTFTIKGWLFKDANSPGAPIYVIDQSFTGVPKDFNFEILDDNYETQYNNLSATRDLITVSAIPSCTNLFYSTTGTYIPVISDVVLNTQQPERNTFLLYGTSFKYTNAILLSSNNSTLTTGFTSVSSKRTGQANGFVLDSKYYQILNDNILTFSIPPLTASGDIDIIINNEAGWNTTQSIGGFHIISQ